MDSNQGGDLNRPALQDKETIGKKPRAETRRIGKKLSEQSAGVRQL